MKVTRSVVWWRGVASAPDGELRLRREKRPRVAVEFFCDKGQLNRHTRYRPATTTRNTSLQAPRAHSHHMSGSEGRASPRASAWVHTRSLAVSFGIYQRIGGERSASSGPNSGFPRLHSSAHASSFT